MPWGSSRMDSMWSTAKTACNTVGSNGSISNKACSKSTTTAEETKLLDKLPGCWTPRPRNSLLFLDAPWKAQFRSWCSIPKKSSDRAMSASCWPKMKPPTLEERPVWWGAKCLSTPQGTGSVCWRMFAKVWPGFSSTKPCTKPNGAMHCGVAIWCKCPNGCQKGSRGMLPEGWIPEAKGGSSMLAKPAHSNASTKPAGRMRPFWGKGCGPMWRTSTGSRQWPTSCT